MNGAQYAPTVPFNTLPGLPPKAELDAKAILRACIPARAALAELSAAADVVPDPTILINILPVLEAGASSAIENIVTTTDRLFQFSAQDAASADPATKEALRYRTALRHGFDLLPHRPVSTNLAADVCTVLRGIQTDIRTLPGTALKNASTGAVVYTPPEGQDRLRVLMANWETFLHSEAHLDPLIRMAVGHYQFEAIHPFEDGNGRTGRILNLLFLVEQGLLRRPLLYLSRSIIGTKDDYYRHLLGVTASGRWEQWVLYMLRAVEDTSRWTTAKIRAMQRLLGEATTYVRSREPKIYSHELIDVIFEQPYCRISNVVDKGIARRQTAAEYLARLVDIGVLEAVQSGREKLFIHRTLMNLLASDDNEVRPYGAI
ncbi:MAG: protein adenylyltransferase Fic [Bacteroidales bacterium]